MIPAMTDPLGRYWEQPPREDILVDETHAVMRLHTFDALKEYSSSLPSGVYDGKMWKSRVHDGWLLCWYGPSDDPNRCSINRREIIQTL